MVDSANGAPLIWRPIGKPEFVKPQGTVMAGTPYTSNAHGLPVVPPPAGGVAAGVGGFSVAAMVAGGVFIVGVINRSTAVKTFLISLRTKSTCRRASAYTCGFTSL